MGSRAVRVESGSTDKAGNGASTQQAEDRFSRKLRKTNRGIRSNVLGDASGFSNRCVELVAEDAGSSCFFRILASAAGELELLVLFVLLRIEHVAALGAKAEGDLLKLLLSAFHCGRGR